jgi:transcriptional regulator with XRE-family HTH domain
MPKSEVGDASEPLDGRPVSVLREIRGLTQEQLAQAAGISRSKLSGIETGERGMDREVRVKLARGLGVPVRVFDQTLDFVRHVDREAGIDRSWTWGAALGWSGSATRGDEVVDGSAATRHAMRRQKHRRIAESVGRATEALVFEHLESTYEKTYDDL